MIYQLRPRAENDIAAIADHLAMESPRAAVALVERLRQRGRLLALNPFSGPARDDVSPGLRHLVVGPYLTFYRVEADHIEILHGRRDLRTIEGLGMRRS